mgnify:CR=1 FL=1
MQQVKIVTLEDGNLITKIDKALQKLGKDIANRPEVDRKSVV